MPLVEGNREELGDPFEAATGGMDEGVMDLRGLMFQVGAAAMQVAAAGHEVGNHSFSHPYDLARLSLARYARNPDSGLPASPSGGSAP